MTEREKQAEAIAAMIATDIQSAAARLEQGESLQLQMTYELFLELRSQTKTIRGKDGAPMYFGEARAMINNSIPTGELSYMVLIATAYRKLEGVI